MITLVYSKRVSVRINLLHSVPSVLIVSVEVLGIIVVGFLPEIITIIGIQIKHEITKTQTNGSMTNMTFPERAPMVTDM